MIRVTAVQPESIAEELGLAAGTELLTVNGRELEDFLDWEFLTAEEEFLLHVRQPDGEEIEFDIERPLGEPIGVALEPARIRRCANRCDFCFVDGLPDGLREVLYIRDDDYRLSFRYGNFATLTNLKPQRHRAHHRVPAVAALRLGARDRSHRAALPAPQSDRAGHPPAAARLRRPRHRVPHPDRDVARRQRRGGARADAARAVRVRARDPGLLGRAGRAHRVQQASSGARADGGGVPRRHRAGRERARPSRGGSAACTGPSAPTSSTCAPGVELPPAEIYDGFEQVENGVGTRALAAAADRDGGAASCDGWAGRRDRRGDRHRDGPLMPHGARAAGPGTGARFELIPVVNSLFGAVGHDRGAACPARALQQALSRPARSRSRAASRRIDQRRRPVHGQHEPRAALGAAVPMELRLSKDFIDALQRAGGGMSKPTVAIVGPPQRRQVHPVQPHPRRPAGHRVRRPGTTRDRHFGDAEWQGRQFWLVDTGGLVPESRRLDGPRDPAAGRVRARRKRTSWSSWSTGGTACNPVDQAIAERLRKARRPCVLAVNKLDDLERSTGAVRVLSSSASATRWA